MRPIDQRQTIGPYDVLEVIGHGGMATVYRALQRDLDRTVALKVLLPVYLHDASFRARFQLEARLVARLRHPNIVGVYDVSEDDGLPYLVMEYLDGNTLHAALVERRRQGRVFSPVEALTLLKPLANALDYAHSRSIIHRDLKPENIILTTHGPVITDFGLAKLMQEEAATVSIVMGTPAYMAPEQIEAQAVDARTDVYALGIMLYELLSGHVPYEGTSPVAVAQAHLSQPIPSLASLVPDHDLSFEIDAVAQRAIAKNKEDRWPSAGAMVAALEDAVAAGTVQLSDRPTVSLPVTPPAPRNVVLPAPRVRRPPKQESRASTLLLLIPLLAIVVGGILGVRYLTTRPAETANEEQPGASGVLAAESASTIVPSPARTPSPVPSIEDTTTAVAGVAAISTAVAGVMATPTLPSTPTPDTGVRGVIQAPTGAFLRSGPGTDYPVIGGLPDQAAVTVLQQIEGWLDVAAETGERGWLATVLFEPRSGDIASLPQGELPPTVQAPTQAAPIVPTPTQAAPIVPIVPTPTQALDVPTQVPPVPPPAPPAQPGTALRFEDTDFVGGFRNSGASVYGGRTATWAYGQGSGYSSMAATFTVEQVVPGTATVMIEGMDSEDPAKTPMRVELNGVVLFEGASPFPNDDQPLETGRWDAFVLEFDAASLRSGANTLTITNLKQGSRGLPPFVAVDYAVITLP